MNSEFYFKATQTDRSSTASATDDPDLLVALTSGITYRIKIALSFFSASATPGIRYAFKYSSTLTDGFLQLIETTAQSADNTTTIQINIGLSGVITGGTNFTRSSSATANTTHRIHAFLILQPSANGTFSIQWAQSVSNGTATSLAAGSHMIVEW